jgi:hypothetical protein
MRASTLGIVFVVLNAIAGCASSGDDDDGGTTPPPSGGEEVCGDGLCASSEVGSCTADCGGSQGAVCGNNTCDAGESNTSCPNDCQAAVPMCGDGACDMAGGENSTNCPGDCGGNQGGTLDCNDQAVVFACVFCSFDPTQCVPPATAEACEQCLGGGGGLTCGDGTCDPAAGEDTTSCPIAAGGDC